jgi:tetratricopeptide (TPR) repeat protein
VKPPPTSTSAIGTSTNWQPAVAKPAAPAMPPPAAATSTPQAVNANAVPPVVTAPPPKTLSALATAKAEEAAAKEQGARMKAIEKTIAERRAEQERVARQLEDLKKQIMDSAQSLRDLKMKTDTLSGIQVTNAVSIASLEQQLVALQKPPTKVVQDLQGQLAEKNRELEALKKQQAQVPPAAKPAPAPAPAPAPVAAKPAATEVPVAVYKLVADGNQSLRSGKLADAEQAFQQALAQAPGLTGAKVGLAACRYNTGQLDDALRLAGEVLGVDRKNAQALGVKGIVLWQQGKLREANQALSDAVNYDPSDSQLHNYLGVILQARDEADAAVREVRKAVELDSANAEARYNLAVLLATSRRPALYEARVHYEAAVQMGNPRDAAMDKLLYGTATASP